MRMARWSSTSTLLLLHHVRGLYFRWGHVRQLDRVSRELLARSWAAGAGPSDAPFTAPTRAEARASMPAHAARTLAPTPSAPPSRAERRLGAPAPPGERRHARRTLRQPDTPRRQASIGGFGVTHHTNVRVAWGRITSQRRHCREQ